MAELPKDSLVADHKFLLASPHMPTLRVDPSGDRKNMVRFYPIKNFEKKFKSSIDQVIFQQMLMKNFEYDGDVGFAIVLKKQLPMFNTIPQVIKMGSFEALRRLNTSVPSPDLESEGEDESL
jgi:hypothetical protein